LQTSCSEQRAQHDGASPESASTGPIRAANGVGTGLAPQAQLKAFYQVFRYTFDDASYGNAPITNLLFRYRDGELIGAQLVD
jgi:hypothetical protein